MTLIVFEGFDGVGKSTLVNKLYQKHNHQYKVLMTAYPTARIRAATTALHSFRMKDIDSLFKYHYKFLEDFARNNSILEGVLDDGNLVLCDRYFYSSAVYFVKDLAYYMVEHKLDGNVHNDRIVTNLQLELLKTLGSFYTDLIQPDLILYMVAKNFNGDPWAKVADRYYKGVFGAYPPRREVLQIHALHTKTVESVESVLKEYGYL